MAESQNVPLLPVYSFSAHLVAGLAPIEAVGYLDFFIDRPLGMKGFILNLTVHGEVQDKAFHPQRTIDKKIEITDRLYGRQTRHQMRTKRVDRQQWNILGFSHKRNKPELGTKTHSQQ